jgi:hypothetical protein
VLSVYSYLPSILCTFETMPRDRCAIQTELTSVYGSFVSSGVPMSGMKGGRSACNELRIIIALVLHTRLTVEKYVDATGKLRPNANCVSRLDSPPASAGSWGSRPPFEGVNKKNDRTKKSHTNDRNKVVCCIHCSRSGDLICEKGLQVRPVRIVLLVSCDPYRIPNIC